MSFEGLDDSGHASKQPSPSNRDHYGIRLHPQVVHLFQHLQSSSALSCQDVQIIVAGVGEDLCYVQLSCLYAY